MRLLLFVIATVLLLFIMTLGGCYNQRKAAVQHGKAVATFPAIGADYCARVYPAKDSLIKGDSVVMFDTLWGEGVIIVDTLRLKDTLLITKQLPGKVITQRIRVVDTFRVVDKAALDLCSIERLSAITQLEKRTAEYDDMKAKRNKWRLIAIGLMVVLGLGIIAKFKKWL